MLLRSAASGNADARVEVVRAAYGDLCRMAKRAIRLRGNSGMTSTELAHETAIRILSDVEFHCNDRRQFYAYVSRIMRNLLIDCDRRRFSRKRGGDVLLHPLVEEATAGRSECDEILSLREAVTRLAKLDERKAKVVGLRFFEGRTYLEIASALGISEATAKRDWEHAKCWLFDHLSR
ncbi:MAG: ECF-type sigma factor [Planctomycetota bacterium]